VFLSEKKEGEELPPKIYEAETVTVEEYVEKSAVAVTTEQAQTIAQTTPTAKQAVKEEQARERESKAQEVSDQEAEDLVTLIKKLREKGYNVVFEYSNLDLLKSQVKYSRKLYNNILGECKGAIIGFIVFTQNLVEYWYKWNEVRGLVDSVIIKTRSDILESLKNLLTQVQAVTSARGLLDILDSVLAQVQGIYEKIKTARIDLGSLISSAKSAVDALLSKTTDREARKSIEAYKSALDLLADKSRLKDMLARFFVLMDLVRDETYKLYMDSYFVYSRSLQALINIIQDKASYDDFVAGLSAAMILLELENKGALDVEKLFPVKQERTYRYHYESKLKAIESGVLPSREPVGVVQLAETLTKIDPSRYVYDLVYNSLKEVFGESIAKGLASAASGATTGVVLKIAPAFGVVLVLEGVCDLGSRVANPIDREILAKFLKDNWEEVAIYTAITVAAALGAGFAVDKLKTPVLTKIADAIERVSPTFAEKIRELIAPKVIVGKPIYQERNVEVYVTDDGKLVLIDRSKGVVEEVQSFKLSDKVIAQLKDPDVGLKVGSWVAKYGKGVKSIGLVGDDLVFVGDTQLAIFSPTKGLIVIDRTSPLLDVARTSPESFKLYYVASKLGLSSDDLLDPALNQYLSLFKQQGYVYGQVNVKGLVFDFRGDKLYIVSGVKEIATIDLARFDGAMFLNLLTAGKNFLNAHGQLYYHIALDTIAFGYGLLSPQTVSLDVLSRLSVIPAMNINDILPRVQHAIGATGFSTKGQIYVSSQVLATGVKVENLFSREVVKSVLGNLGFKESQISIIEFGPEVAAYIKMAQATGGSGLGILSKAAEIAKSAGDSASAQLLTQLLVNLQLSQIGLMTLYIASTSNTGALFGFTAVSTALAGVSQQVAEQVVKGDSSSAKQTLINALLNTGLSEQVAKQLAEEFMKSLPETSKTEPTITVDVIIPVRATKDIYVSKTQYETIINQVETSERDIVVDAQLVIPVSAIGETYTSTVKYDAELKYVETSSEDIVIDIPVTIPVSAQEEIYLYTLIAYEPEVKQVDVVSEDWVITIPVVIIIPEKGEVYTPVSEYEVVEQYSSEKLRDIIVTIPVEVVIPVKSVVYVPVSKYEVIEQFSSEKIRDIIVTIPVEYVVSETGEVYLAPTSAFETLEQYSTEWLKDVVVTKPVTIVVPKTREAIAVTQVYETEEKQVSEAVKGIIEYVFKPVEETTVVSIPVDVEEEYTPPPPTTPQVTGATTYPPIPPPTGVREGEKRKQEERRGIGELEVLVY
jgi:hypothetical protein